MDEGPDNVPSRQGAGQGNPFGVGAAPSLTAIAESPYNVLPDVTPDDTVSHVIGAMQRLQRKKLEAEQDQALRALRDLGTRLSWDLLALGTTPRQRPSNGMSRAVCSPSASAGQPKARAAGRNAV